MSIAEGYFGLTDLGWFRFLSARTGLTSVNFWKPGAISGFPRLQPLSPFFFQLKKPHYRIAGYGFFVKFVRMPIGRAWECFGEANGAADEQGLIRMIASIDRKRRIDRTSEIGCVLVDAPVLFEEREWIPRARWWPNNVVSGMKGKILEEEESRRIWEACQARAIARRTRVAGVPHSDRPRQEEWVLARRRLDQPLFRALVTDAYGGACAISTEHSLPALEAAHIKPYGEDGRSTVTNGILMRSDIHKLFDAGYLTITPEHRVEVSQGLKRDFNNGRSYLRYHGKEIRLPADRALHPSPEMLRWHNTDRYENWTG